MGLAYVCLQLASAVHDQRHAEEMLAAEKERATLVEREWEQLKESRDLAEKRAQQAQGRLHEVRTVESSLHLAK